MAHAVTPLNGYCVRDWTVQRSGDLPWSPEFCCGSGFRDSAVMMLGAKRAVLPYPA
jgi:hypothetical protein